MFNRFEASDKHKQEKIYILTIIIINTNNYSPYCPEKTVKWRLP